MCDLSVVKEFPHLMKQLDLKLPRLYSTMSTQLVYKSKLASTSDPTINIRRGYVMGCQLSLSEVKKTKSYAVNDCNTMKLW
jgi:hypothetical protein